MSKVASALWLLNASAILACSAGAEEAKADKTDRNGQQEVTKPHAAESKGASGQVSSSTDDQGSTFDAIFARVRKSALGLNINPREKNARLRQQLAINAYTKTLQDSKAQLFALGPSVIGPLVEKLNSDDLDFANVSSGVLEHFGKIAIAPVSAAIESRKIKNENQSRAVNLLEQIGQDSIPALVKLLNGDVVSDKAMILHSIEGAAKNHSKTAYSASDLESVRKQTNSSNLAVRQNALAALAFMSPDDQKLVSRLEKIATSDSDAALRNQCLFSLSDVAQFSKARRSDELASFLANIATHSKNVEDRAAAIGALASISQSPKTVLPVIRKALTDSNEIVKRAAHKALYNFSSGAAGLEALPDLVELLENVHSVEAVYAIDAIGKIGAPAASAMPKLIEAANKTDSKDTGARAALATAFKNMGDAGSSGAPSLVPMLKESSPGLRLIIASSLIAMGKNAKSAESALYKLEKEDSKVGGLCRLILKKLNAS
jgi:hypothetical protein